MAPLLRVSDLQTHYFSFGGSRVVKAVDGVSFTLSEGETLGLVGESGCGKTTTCLSIVGLLPPAARIVGGSIDFAGRGADAESAARDAPHPRRADRDDPAGSDGLAEPAVQHLPAGRRAGLLPSGHARPLVARSGCRSCCARCASPRRTLRMREYPHQMSGGMRQRVVGAIAMAGGPKLIIADEPTTNLDVTIQAQYLDVLKDIQQETGVAIIFVTHNLGIVAKHVRQDGGHVCRQDRRARRGARPVHARRSTPTPRPCSARCRSSAARSRCSRSRASRPISRSLPPGCAFHPRCARCDAAMRDRGAAGDRLRRGLDGAMLARRGAAGKGGI